MKVFSWLLGRMHSIFLRLQHWSCNGSKKSLGSKNFLKSKNVLLTSPKFAWANRGRKLLFFHVFSRKIFVTSLRFSAVCSKLGRKTRGTCSLLVPCSIFFSPSPFSSSSFSADALLSWRSKFSWEWTFASRCLENKSTCYMSKTNEGQGNWRPLFPPFFGLFRTIYHKKCKLQKLQGRLLMIMKADFQTR